MEHDVTEFWTDIKKYEEALANDPASYCFVPLSDLYRRIGLLDDAIHVAKKGCDIHPDYTGGYMALGRAYFEKGMKPESKAALEKVIASTPDNLLARRLLSQIYVEFGEIASAVDTLRYILSFNPADNESQVLLNSLKTSSGPDQGQPTQGTAVPDAVAGVTATAQQFEFLPEGDDIIEDAELLEDVVEEEPADDFAFTPPDEALADQDQPVFIEEHDPLRTATMAELYVSQGFLKRALTIYRELLETDPNNAEWKKRLYEIKRAIDEDTAMARKVAAPGGAGHPGPSRVGEQAVAGAVEDVTPPPSGDDVVLGTLEKWLENARRRR